MKEHLALTTSQNFGNVQCDFWYDNGIKEFLMTRDQIGSALGYKNPQDSIFKIHERHKDRLDRYSLLDKVSSTDGKSYDTYLYSSKGIYEICRWSRQPKADAFMDWVWGIIDNLRTGELTLTKNNVSITPELIDGIISQYIAPLESRIISQIDRRMNTIANSYQYLLNIMENQVQQTPVESVQVKTPIIKDESWQNSIYERVNKIASYKIKEYKNSKDVLRALYATLQNTYGVAWDQEQKKYREKYRVTGRAKTLNLIAEDENYKSIFSNLLSDIECEVMREVEINESSDIKSVIEPLIEIRTKKGDFPKFIYRDVYSRMGVGWNMRQTRYKNVNGLKNNPTKSKLILSDPKLFKIFKKTVEDMLLEVAQ